MKRFTIGTDPEFFLRRKEDGKLISAIPHIKGTKDDPEKLPKGGQLQFDNVAVEFATAPAENGMDLVNKIRETFKDVLVKLPENHELLAEPSAYFDEDQLACDAAQAFGCSPDYDAWVPKENDPPRCAESNFRSCGGHIHVGKVEGDNNDFLLDPWGKIRLVKVMDCIHGIISVLLDNSPEAVARRKLYGKAGCHRPVIKDAGGHYDGVEYRVLSNFWLKSPELVMLMDSLTTDALSVVREEAEVELIEGIGGPDVVQRIINEGQTERAEAALKSYITPLLSEDSRHYLKSCLTNINNYNFVKEWQLEV